MGKRRAERTMRQRTIRQAAMIFQPSRVCGILVKVARADVMVLSVDHPPKPREERFRIVRVTAVQVAVFDRVVDPTQRPTCRQNVPMRRFVGVDRAVAFNRNTNKPKFFRRAATLKPKPKKPNSAPHATFKPKRTWRSGPSGCSG